MDNGLEPDVLRVGRTRQAIRDRVEPAAAGAAISGGAACATTRTVGRHDLDGQVCALPLALAGDPAREAARLIELRILKLNLNVTNVFPAPLSGLDGSHGHPSL